MRNRVWGFDGFLRGNEGRLFAVNPAIELDDHVWFSPRSTFRGSQLRGPLSIADAKQRLCELPSNVEFHVFEESMFVLAGPVFVLQLDLVLGARPPRPRPHGITEPSGWSTAIDEFRGAVLNEDVHEELQRWVTEVASSVFHSEIGTAEGTYISPRAEAAYRLVQASPVSHREDRLIQAGVFHCVANDHLRYERAALAANAIGINQQEFDTRVLERLARIRSWSGERDVRASVHDDVSQFVIDYDRKLNLLEERVTHNEISIETVTTVLFEPRTAGLNFGLPLEVRHQEYEDDLDHQMPFRTGVT